MIIRTNWITPVLMLLGLGTFLSDAGEARSAEVFVQYDGSNLATNPIAVAASGPGYAASADLGTGAFLVSASANGNLSQNAYAGILTPLAITNAGPNILYLEAGAIRATITGTYGLGTQADSVQSADLSSVLSIDAPAFPLAPLARADHQVGRSYDADGILIGEVNRFQAVYEAFGGNVRLVTADLDGADFDLLMPAFTLLPGETMELSFQLTTSVLSQSAGAVSSTFQVPFGLTVTVPAGFDLADLDLSSPGAGGVLVVPEPGHAHSLVFGICLLVGIAMRGRSRKAADLALA